MCKFVECDDCEFVLLAQQSSDPIPKRQDACPRCGATEFRFLEDGTK
ncbi:hypothetical protein [Natronococcus occultus]|nr:hypothetical protein [Natronococcus occultus]